MRGSAEKKVTPSEAKNKIVARKSIVASKPIARGEAFSEDNVTCKRPGNGISPMCWNELMGITAMRDFEEDELIVAEGFRGKNRLRVYGRNSRSLRIQGAAGKKHQGTVRKASTGMDDRSGA